jgi:anti-anti-sigma factor
MAIEKAASKDKSANISTNYEAKEHQLVIHIGGRFDFRALNDFRDSYEKSGHVVNKYIIDLSQSDYLDSSALGMLLTLRDYAGGENSNIKIINTPSDIKRILYITKLDSLFEII